MIYFGILSADLGSNRSGSTNKADPLFYFGLQKEVFNDYLKDCWFLGGA